MKYAADGRSAGLAAEDAADHVTELPDMREMPDPSDMRPMYDMPEVPVARRGGRAR
jgi:hypothetical protein